MKLMVSFKIKSLLTLLTCPFALHGFLTKLSHFMCFLVNPPMKWIKSITCLTCSFSNDNNFSTQIFACYKLLEFYIKIG